MQFIHQQTFISSALTNTVRV